MLSLPDAKAYLNITSTTFDAEIQTFIDAAEAAIEVKVGPLSPVSFTERLTANGGPLVPTRPVVSITSAVHLWSGLSLYSADLEVSQNVLTRRYGVGFINGPWDITYMAGRNPLPADLLMAAKELLRHLWATQRGPEGRRPGSQDSEGASNRLAGAGFLLPFRVLELIAPYETQGFA